MDLQFIKEVFPFHTEAEIQNIIAIVIESNPDENPERQLDVVFDMLGGDMMPGDVQVNAGAEHMQERVEEEVSQMGSDSRVEDDTLEGAVGHGHAAPVDNSVIQDYCNNLQNIFPEAAPDFLWEFCRRKGAGFNLDDAVDELSRDGYDRIVLDASAIWERLKDALPGWDPSYLEQQSRKLALEDPNNLEAFVITALENNDPPTMEQYLKRKTEEDKLNRYKDANFKLEKFLETFPDPEHHFKDTYRPNPLTQEGVPEEDLFYAKTFLYNRYRDIRKRHVDLVFKMKDMKLMDCCDMLDTIQKGLKTKRKEESMPDSKNLALLQEIMYIKHRRLIRRLLRYKGDTYNEFKEQARALNLLKTCQVCGEDELIPEECFSCQKGCLFCKDCVKRYVEVRMGDGLTTFPCCNTCDSEFTLHILQIVLPQHMFERLVLKIQSEEIKKANVEGLETCPFCEFATIPAENTTIFTCENVECMKESCRLCRHESHIPKRCNEIEYDEDVRRRTYIENMMTEALARTCHSCKKKFIKSNGCNKMVCNCGAIMCYQCSQAIAGYDHFGAGKCQLFTNDAEVDLTRVRQRAEQAKQELGNVEIKFDPTVGIENFFVA